MVVIDTSIIIDHLRQKRGLKSTYSKLIEKYWEQSLAISIISIQELYRGQSLVNKDKESELLASISSLDILPYDYKVAKKAGQLARNIKKDIGFADLAIAATALTNNSHLATLNSKDFQQIEQLELIDILEL